jgi:hypothetical protein
MRWNDVELEKVKAEIEKKFENLIKAKYGVDVSKPRNNDNDICTDEEFIAWCKNNGCRGCSAYSGTIEIGGVSILIRNEKTIFECEDIEYTLTREGFSPKKTLSKYFHSFETLEKHLNDLKLFAKRVAQMKNVYKTQEDFV